MLYLNEREVGFDPAGIGFPSISGCLVIAWVNNNGIFGFHNAGGGGTDAVDNDKRAAAFADFVSKHFLRGDTGTRLYSVTYASGDQARYPQKDAWKAEVLGYANALRYDGAIRGYDLGDAAIPPSAYVELRKAGDKCEIWVKKWSDADRTRGPCATPMHHQWIKRDGGGNYSVLPITAQVVTSVTTTHLRRVHSSRLRD